MRGGWRMGAASRRSIGLLRLPGFLCSYVLSHSCKAAGNNQNHRVCALEALSST